MEKHLIKSCPDEDLEPLSMEPLADLLRIRRKPEDEEDRQVHRLRRALWGDR